MSATSKPDWINLPVLTGGVETEVRRSIMRVYRLMAAGAPRGALSRAKLSALAALARYGPMTAGGLSGTMIIRPQSLTRVLAQLEKAGLTVRARGVEDAREHLVSITQAGAEVVRQEGKRRDALMSEAMRRALTSLEIEVLAIAARILDKMADEWSTDRAAAVSSAVE